MKEILIRLSAILLIGLLLVKISAFHVYEHHDSVGESKEPCERCVLIIEGQQLESLTPSTTVVECATLQIPSQHNISSLAEGHMLAVEEGILFSRPPPRQLA